jgi:hypothetical protein
MTDANPTPRWDEPGWDSLPYAVKAAAMQAFLTRVGYDPEKSRHEAEHRLLTERISSLEHEVQSLKLQLKGWIDAEQAAAQQRLNAQKHL